MCNSKIKINRVVIPSHTDPNGKRSSSELLLWLPPQANGTSVRLRLLVLSDL